MLGETTETFGANKQTLTKPPQEPHVRRGHPITFGLILLFALIEGCVTAWLGELSRPLATQSTQRLVASTRRDEGTSS